MQRHQWLARASLAALALIAACGATRPAVDPPISESAAPGDAPVVPTRQPRERATVTRLIDGDTLLLHLDGREQSVRLLLIDAPETDLDQCFGAAASAFVAAVAPPGSTLEVEQDVSDADPFGRLLRYVYLADGSMLNKQLVRGGFARVTPVPPDQKYIELLLAAETIARRDRIGLWSACATPTPAVAAQHTVAASPTPFSAAVVAAPSPAATPTPTPEPSPSATATLAPTAVPTAAVDPRAGCDPSYPTVCIPPSPPDLDCGDIPFRRFTVVEPDPHRFDGDNDGVGCES